jgi:hypothetical protein
MTVTHTEDEDDCTPADAVLRLECHLVPRDGNSGTGTIFYPRVAPVPDPNRDGYGTGIFPTRG